MENNYFINDLNNELYFDPKNKVILCRKYKFRTYSIVSIATFVSDTKTTIVLYETQNSKFKNFIKIDYNNLDKYPFLNYVSSTRSYKNKDNIIKIPIDYKYIKNYYYDTSYHDNNLIEKYKIKENYYRIKKLQRILDDDFDI